MTASRKALEIVIAVLTFCAVAGVMAPVPSLGQSMNAAGSPCDGSGSTADTTACFSKAYRAEDHELNVLYARIQKALEEDEKAELVLAERLWVQYRDATCEAERALYGGGSGGAPTRLACLAAETRARRESLLRSYGWRLEKRGL
jgi:uncharacterized protein YecT (DUF1311 family)